VSCSGTIGVVGTAARVEACSGQSGRRVLRSSTWRCRDGLHHGCRTARQRAGAWCGRCRETGSAAIWMLSFAMVMWVLVAAVVAAASAMTARHRAAAAADLSALAGASALARAMEKELLAGAGRPPHPPQAVRSPQAVPPPQAARLAPSLTPAQLAAIACGAANSTATANGAQLLSCAVDGSTLAIEAAVGLPRLARWAHVGGTGSGLVSARARAGPS